MCMFYEYDFKFKGDWSLKDNLDMSRLNAKPSPISSTYLFLSRQGFALMKADLELSDARVWAAVPNSFL